jgi:hypothetical protein
MATGVSGQFGVSVVHLVVLVQNHVIVLVLTLFLPMVVCHVLETLMRMMIAPCQIFVQV